jgi:hypothetical protein
VHINSRIIQYVFFSILESLHFFAPIAIIYKGTLQLIVLCSLNFHEELAWSDEKIGGMAIHVALFLCLFFM